MKSLIIAIFVTTLSLQTGASEWTSLFNGKDLSGWETYISFQPETNQYNLQSKHTPRGVGVDPKDVFSVVNGTLRISGEEWGGLTTTRKFSNFHLRFEVKWGDKKWPPRLDAKRDSGVLYYAVGDQGAEKKHWMRSHEFQIQEGDCGDYHSLDGVIVDTHVGDANEGDWKFFRYDPKLPLKSAIAARILRLGSLEGVNHEQPNGEWNLMEIIAQGQTIIHKVNGHEVMRVYNSQEKRGSTYVPLTSGKIQIQSEGAEVFYRNIEIKALTD